MIFSRKENILFAALVLGGSLSVGSCSPHEARVERAPAPAAQPVVSAKQEPARTLATVTSVDPEMLPPKFNKAKRKKRQVAAESETSEPRASRNFRKTKSASEALATIAQAGQPVCALNSGKPESNRAPASEAPVEVAEEPAVSGLFRDFWVWIGAGANHTSYSQSVSGFSDVEFGKIKALTKSFQAGFFPTDQFGLDLGYRDVPGEVSRSATISVTNGSYNWRTLEINALYRKDETAPWLIRAGVQMQETPFMVPLSANSITVTESNSTALVLGFDYRKMRKKLRLEYGLRYIHPVSSSAEITSDFKLKPRFAAAGSIGAAYEMKENIFLGTQLGAVYQNNKFSYKNSAGSSFSGTQSILSTSAEIRLGVEF